MDNHGAGGKWSTYGVPHKGWSCVDVEDTEEPSEICGMCEKMQIRFVHVMKHPAYPTELRVGCVCAERMEQDSVAPKARENGLRNAARRKITWQRRQWRVSEKGNVYINTDGFNIVAFVKDARWCLRITNRANEKSRVSQKDYGTQDEAKAAGLHALIWAKVHLA